jgi:DNA-binding transcriptional MerR regulator
MVEESLKVNQVKNPSKSIDEIATELPTIPDKLYFSIGEVSKLCILRPHVLRYWENEFPQLKPSKRRGNRRYYQRKDVLLIRQIRNLLYEQGFTIEGARTQLASNDNEVSFSHNAKEIFKNVAGRLEKIYEELLGEEI